MQEKEKYLFAIDLDGTLLSSSSEGTIHEVAMKAIERAKNEGHIVCLVTGRPWRSTRPIYNMLGLDTVVTNYNGAQIHNPSDENFIPLIKYLNLNEMLYILGDPKVKQEISNVAIEGPGWVQLQRRDEALERVFGFKENPKFKVGLDFNKIPLRPTGIIFDVKETTDPDDLRDYLRAKYGDLGEFSYWSKGEGLTPVFDITNVSVNKGRAISLLSRYYDIPLENIVAFGDGHNDISMFKVAKTAVVMKNAPEPVKKHATVRINKKNTEGAVGFYINKFLDNPEEEKAKSLRVRSKMKKNSYVNTEADD
ncbi:Cof-type HAD-IIB family hydrolase [Mycoplasma zalophidermidis]|uniref:Cof-type HAD-IIB family hydrolase n=1 Tax=Mycoplasma zalophidermidis TaxID=398174 RepID=A0ABS6DRS0_9MOLU|nr:Cof-type HAD-IIB family hydrolase [Mycoplasma zalophidermidis]MBU4689598.1 Cof-type HAD-IIB family hydrolase [Mycoplasma zalophidermidis]MBU4693496.1 Cof-type HAD-IIB family hydrolase [Mycoplasma zalophidermidis]MCR8966544.1 Cof-type HAD-IIB family hydrolase [Mycoplasma zalophidermidis]